MGLCLYCANVHESAIRYQQHHENACILLTGRCGRYMLPDTCLKARVHASACQIPYTRYTSFGNCSRERSRERECSGTGIIDLLLMDTHARVRLSSGLADVIFGAVVTCNTVQQIFGFTGHRENNKEFNQKTDCSLFRDTNIQTHI